MISHLIGMEPSGGGPADGIYLRPMLPDDLEQIHRWHNSEELYRTLLGQFRPVTREVVRKWLKRQTAPSERELNLAICRASSSEHIGNIYLKDIDPIARSAELHIFIGEPGLQGHGFGTAALRILLRHAFGNLGLQRIFLHVLEDNERAIRAYRKCGFIVEGNLRRHVCKDGRFKNVLVMGILSEEAGCCGNNSSQ